MSKKHLKTSTYFLVITLLLACGEKDQTSSSHNLTNYKRRQYFSGTNSFANKSAEKRNFLNLLYSDDWIAIDEDNGRPFYGTALRFNANGMHPTFDMTLPDNSPVNAYYERRYIGEIHENSIDDPTLEWVVMRPGPCGLSKVWFDGIQKTSLGTELRILFHRNCGSSYLSSQMGSGVHSIEVQEEFTFQRVTEVNRRLTSKKK